MGTYWEVPWGWNWEILGDTIGLEVGDTGRYCGAGTGKYWEIPWDWNWEILGDTMGLELGTTGVCDWAI